MINRKKYNILGAIPARGGSKGITRKNVKNIGGKPLIAYTINNALQAQAINRLIISTDDTEIAEVSESYGAEVVRRPEELSGDKASSESALLHLLKFLKDTENYQPDILVFLQCTSPLTLPEDIDGAVQALIDERADSALAVTPFYHFLWNYDHERNAECINHDKNFRPLRQDMEPQYLETGAVYVMRVEGFIKAQHRFFGKTTLFITPPERHIEIDEPKDLFLAEMLLKNRSRHK